MIHAYGDPAFEFTARESTGEERRAGLLSRTDGRSVDGFGFSTGLGVPSNGRDAGRRRARNQEPRKRRLQIARWWAQARREREAEAAESHLPGDAVAPRAAELRAAQEACDAAGEGEDCLEPVGENNRFFNAGVDAFDRGVPIYDCPCEGPSAEQDDWLRGWLTAQLHSEEAPSKTPFSPDRESKV